MDKRRRWNKGQELGQFLPVPSIRANKRCHSPNRNRGKRGFKGENCGSYFESVGFVGLWANWWRLVRGQIFRLELREKPQLQILAKEFSTHRWYLWEQMKSFRGVWSETGRRIRAELRKTSNWGMKKGNLVKKKEKEWGVVSREVTEKPRVVGVTGAKWRTCFEEIVSTPLNGA